MAATLVDYANQVGDVMRQGVIETFVREVPLLGILNVIDLGDKESYKYNREASLGGVGYRAVNGDYAAAAKTVGVINPAVEGVAILGGEVAVDINLSSPGYRAGRIGMKTKAAAKFFARQLFDGDSSADPLSIDGLNRRLVGTSGDRPTLIWAGTNGDQVTVKMLRSLIASVVGGAADKRLLMSARMKNTVKAVVEAHGATMKTIAEWGRGGDGETFDGVPIVEMGEDESGVEILAFDEKRGNSSVTGSIYCIRPGSGSDEEYVQLLGSRAAEYGVFQVLQRGATTTQDKWLVEGKLGLGLFHGHCAARLGGILEAI